MAGALEASSCAANNCAKVTTAATTAITLDAGLTLPTDNVTAGTSGTCASSAPAVPNQLYLAVNNGPCALGSTAADPNYGNNHYVEAVVSQRTPTFFARVFGANTVTVTARAEAGYAVPPPGSGNKVWANTVKLNGGSIADADGKNGGVYADSEAFADGGKISAPYTLNSAGKITGNCYNNGTSCGPKPTSVTADPEPFSTLVEPTKPGNSTTNTGATTTVSKATTLQPGTYSSLNFNGGGYTVTLSPGLYYFTGTLNGSNITLTGDNVTLFFEGSGYLQTNTGETVNLTPPSADYIASNPSKFYGCTSCATMSIWASTDDTQTQIVDANFGGTFTGNIYAKNGEIRMNGGHIDTQAQIVCKLLNLATGSITIDSNSGGTPNGSPKVSLAE
jgi:hypothetical protein